MDILISDNEKDKYIYKKSDFLKLGVPEGSFRPLMEKLNLNTPEYCIKKILPENNNRPILYYTQEAYEKVAKYQEEKEEAEKYKESKSTNLPILQELQEYKEKLIIETTRHYKKENELLKQMNDMWEELSNERNTNTTLNTKLNNFEIEKANEIDQAVKEAKKETEERVKAEMNSEINKLKNEKDEIIEKYNKKNDDFDKMQTDLFKTGGENLELQKKVDYYENRSRWQKFKAFIFNK